MAIAMTASCGCRLLETGYGDDNIMVRSSADAVSATTGAAKSTIAWAGAKVMSFGDDLDADRQKLFISIGEHAAAAYRGHPELPEGYRPLSPAEFEKQRLGLSKTRKARASAYVSPAPRRTTRQSSPSGDPTRPARTSIGCRTGLSTPSKAVAERLSSICTARKSCLPSGARSRTPRSSSQGTPSAAESPRIRRSTFRARETFSAPPTTRREFQA